MADIDRSFELLRTSNPHPTVVVEDKPTADEMLRRVQERPAPAPPVRAPRPQWRRGLVLAAAAFAVVLALLAPALLFNAGDEPPVTEPPTTTTAAPTTTTAPPPTTAAPAAPSIEGAWSNLWGVWEFDPDGTYRVSTGGVIRDVGTYAAEGDSVTLTSGVSSRDCPGATGSYDVVIDEAGRPTFQQLAADSCAARSRALDGSTLSQAQPPATEPIDPVLNIGEQALVNEFLALYNGGDVGAFAAFLHPDFERMIIRELSEEPQPVDTVLTLIDVDAALDMELTLDCEARPDTVLCVPTKFDDLLRVLGRPPSDDRAWEFRFEDGLLREWIEQRPNAACCYEVEAIQPFMTWVRENRPEVDALFPFSDGDWIIREGIAEEIAALVDEWAVAEGVPLEN